MVVLCSALHAPQLRLSFKPFCSAHDPCRTLLTSKPRPVSKPPTTKPQLVLRYPARSAHQLCLSVFKPLLNVCILCMCIYIIYTRIFMCCIIYYIVYTYYIILYPPQTLVNLVVNQLGQVWGTTSCSCQTNAIQPDS